MKNKIVIGVLLAAGIGIAAFFFLRQPQNKPYQPQTQPNVLLITIDTIRPDRLSCYGSTNPTPNLDAIARSGVLFENAFTHVPLTFPSHTSILTGLFPIHHGVHNNGLETLGSPESVISFDFHAHGYKTAAVVASFVLDRKFGLSKSFDIYDDRMERRPGISSNFDVERPADAVRASATKILEGFAGQRWFLWVHFYDPHTPYNPPAPLQGYEGEVQFVDQQIGILKDWLENRGLWKDLAVAVTGDHGESLGEHGEATHGFFIYNSTIRIPMLLRYPGAPENTKIQSAAATVDLAPTLLQLAGIQDSKKRDGESLLALIGGSVRKNPIVMESRYAELLGWNRLEGIIQDRWKLISTTRSELYDWQKDPAEANNLYSQQENISTALKARLAGLGDTASEAKTVVDPEALEKLKSLGYVSTTSIAKRGTADPKDKISSWSEYETALGLKNDGKTEESLVKMRELVDREPDNTFLRVSLGGEYRGAGKPADAVDQLKEAVKRDSTSGSAFQELAAAYQDLRNYPEAIKASQAAVALEPNRSEFHNLLGSLMVDTGQFEKAEQEFALVMKIDPNNAVAWNNLGNTYRETGRAEDAIAAYNKSIQLSPHYAYPLNGLATILIQQNKTEEAIPLLQKALDLDPKYVEVYLNLGIAFHTIGQKDKARTLYKSFLKLAPEWMKTERQNAKTLLSNLG